MSLGYEPIGTPEMVGMGQAGQQAAVQQSTVDPAAGNWTSTATGNIFNTETGATKGPGLFSKGGMAQTAIGAIGTLGSLWNSFQQSKIAKKSLQLQERTFETNLANQTKTYNTELEDRIRTRHASERVASAETEKYIEKNKL